MGDDVVIGREEVALKYRWILNSLGVDISDHKRILPRPKHGLEFARKLICCDGNLSPLPTVLLTKQGLVCKFQFLSHIIGLVVGERRQSLPDLEVLLTAIFGKRLRESLGDSFIRYFIFKSFMTQSKEHVKEGKVPGLFQNLSLKRQQELRSNQLLILSIFSSIKIESIVITLNKIQILVIKDFKKATKLLSKDLQKDYTSLLQSELGLLGKSRNPPLREVPGFTNFCVNFGHYLKGPGQNFFLEVIAKLSLENPEVPVPSKDESSHEDFSPLDTFLPRRHLELLDHLIKWGKGFSSYSTTSFLSLSNINTPKRIDRRVTRIRAYKLLLTVRSLVGPGITVREKFASKRKVKAKLSRQKVKD